MRTIRAAFVVAVMASSLTGIQALPAQAHGYCNLSISLVQHSGILNETMNVTATYSCQEHHYRIAVRAALYASNSLMDTTNNSKKQSGIVSATATHSCFSGHGTEATDTWQGLAVYGRAWNKSGTLVHEETMVWSPADTSPCIAN